MFSKHSRLHLDLKRIREVIHVLVKHGFGFFVEQLKKENYFIARQLKRWKIFPISTREPESGLSVAERLKLVLEELGPTYIKLGQILSTRPDLIPIDICEEFSKLQDEVTPVDYDKVCRQVISRFGKPPEELFLNFSKKPLAAASLGQVHTAELNTGEKVIVKIQRPEIEKTIEADIRILLQIAELIHKHISALRVYDLPGIIAQFARTIRNELDFTIEARNIDRFARNMRNQQSVHIPHVYWEYTRDKIITLEKIEGTRLGEFIKTENLEAEKKVIAAHFADAILKMVFIDGFFHADPHPGNIFVISGNRIAFVDFGIISKLGDKLKMLMGEMLMGVVDNDTEKITDLIRKLGAVGKDIDFSRFKTDMNDLLDRYYDLPLQQIKMGQLFSTVLSLMRAYSIKIPRDLYLMIKTIIIAESVVLKLDPDFNMIRHSKPFIAKMIKAQYSISKLVRESKKFSSEMLRLARSAPREIAEILQMMRQGTFKIEFEHQGLDNLIREIDRSSNRISFALVIAALIVGSSLVMLTNTGPRMMDYPVIGLIGYTIAAFLGFWLAIAIIRSGKL